MADVMYVARRTFQYGRPGSEVWIDRGQVVDMVGLVNDEKLIRLGYVSQGTKGIAIVGCRKCGAKFVTDEGLSTHGRDRHDVRSLTPEDEDKRAEQRIAKENEVAPLDLTKTSASRGVRTAAGGR